MRLNNKFWLFAIVCMGFTTSVAVTLAVLFWHQVEPVEQALLIRLIKEQFWYFFSTAVFLLAAFGFTLDWFFRFYILPLNQLIEETQVMNSVNPAHRLKIDGSHDVKRLAELINSCGDRYEAARHRLDRSIESAKAKTEAEKNILATILAELTQGVLICDPKGRIMLYNRQAQRVLDRGAQEDETAGIDEYGHVPEGFVGLHRSVYSLISKDLIEHALKDIRRKRAEQHPDVSACFVMVNHQQRQLRVETLPILDEDHQFAGFVLIFLDITNHLEHSGRLNHNLKTITKTLRSSVAAISSAAELMVQFPDMGDDQKQGFLDIIAQETQTLSRMLRTGLMETTTYSLTRWPLSPILLTDFITMLQNEVPDAADLQVEMAEVDVRCMIRVDTYSLTLAMAFVLQRLKTVGQKRLNCLRVAAPGNLVQMDLMWEGDPIPIETLRQWNDQQLTRAETTYPLTLKEVLDHHHAEIWPHADKQDPRLAGLRLFIPMVRSEGKPEDARQVTLLPKGRPEFYDFDLFSQVGQAPELEKRLLGELVFTVFDTETTGLDPRGGDEIISIGAVRIVNGRLLHTEKIDQLIDPRRPVPAESTKYHGIDAQMLAGKPTIDKVLPFFHRFAQNTVLVGHNVAFDLRMLQMKEKSTGIRFSNPVLDTMHLAAMVHPAHHDHSLDTIAGRLGVVLTKRHDALGDAIATGEIFLKLIPLLNAKGIYTLKEALIASQRTYYARLKY